ncbi:RNA polymerase sigma-70 factor [Streptomyces sp. NPDC008313]|uniref:RNA polymerase sigma-70 factor n=1 Tax=Streptomyces sp. NPDC008313 TaxID=3364826 RepID=UPI0036ECADE2
MTPLEAKKRELPVTSEHSGPEGGPGSGRDGRRGDEHEGERAGERPGAGGPEGEGSRVREGAAAGRPGDGPGHPDPATETFVAHRNLLFTVAYEMLGSAADAEDVLQETWLRWAEVDLGPVRDRRAYLVRITTRQALTRLRTLGRRKESYVGSWLPEPLLTAPDVADDVELADSVSMAMMLVLETLTPTERAVFVLREVFELGYDEIAEAVEKSPAAVRQTAHRARAHVAARRPRGAVSPPETRDALAAFQRAVETGDLQGLLDVLAPDVVLLGDGGGIKQAVLRPVTGADKVARLLLGGLTRLSVEMSMAPAQVNGYPGLIIRLDGELDTVVAARLDHGLITGLYAVRNPEKLTRMRRENALGR